MGNNLPYMPYVDGLGQFRLSQFGGYDHRLGAQNGMIWDMKNLTGDYYPMLASRAPRHTVKTVTKPNGVYSSGKLFLVDGTTLYVDGQAAGTLADRQSTVSKRYYGCLHRKRRAKSSCKIGKSGGKVRYNE